MVLELLKAVANAAHYLPTVSIITLWILPLHQRYEAREF